MTESQMLDRTKQYALRILRLVDALPNTRSGRIIANQLGRSGTSVAANYRAACRARSKKEFQSKLGIVEEEADESLFWLEMTTESSLLPDRKVTKLREEASELVAITVASRRTIAKSLTNERQSHYRKSQIANRKS